MKRFLAFLACTAAGFALGILCAPQKHAAHPAPPQPIVTTTSPLPTATSQTPVAITRSPLEQLRALLATSTLAASLPQACSLINNLTLADLKPALAFIRVARPNVILLDALADRWVALDPLDAFNTAQASRNDNDWRNRLGFKAGAALASTDPETALAKITAAPNNQAREQAANWILPVLAKKDASRAAEYLASNPRLARYDQIFRNVAQAFGAASAQQAIAWAKSLSNKSLSETSVAYAWIGWSQTEPATAAAALKIEPDFLKSDSVVSSLVRNWSRSDLNATLKWIESLPDEKQREGAYTSLQISPSDLGPDRARDALLQIPSKRARDELAQNIARQLAHDNVQDALAWAEKLPADKSRSVALNVVYNDWADSDPSAAAAHLAAQPASKETSEQLTHAISVWSEGDLDAANKFLQTLPAGPARDAAVAGVVRIVANTDSARALELFQSIEDKQTSARLAETFVVALAKSDPATAFRLAAEIPAETQPKVYRDLVRTWATDHTVEAGQWLNTLPNSPSRDSAIEAYVSVIDGTDPAKATQWASAINEPTKRMEAIFQSIDRWIDKDRVAAKNWIDQADIPDPFRPFFDKMLEQKKNND